MNGNRLGCLSPMAIIATIITAFTISGYAVVHGSGMFSAGQLSAFKGPVLGGVTSHAEIGDNCTACHTEPLAPDRMADHCVLCHANIVAEIINSNSLHGKLRGDQTTLDCRTCHPEHRGPDAPLTNLDIYKFPHGNLGFSLNTHQWLTSGDPFTCDNCHVTGKLMEFSQETCARCHLQIDKAFTQTHALTFGLNCTDCHDGVETLGKDFNHKKVAFKLTGKHADVACDKCHIAASTLADLKTTPQECSQCHKKDEPHAGRLGTACADCHTTDGWKPAKFDHNLAQFKLTGKHTSAACDDCHKNGLLQGTPMNCAACHRQDDKHNGQFKEDCGTCHTPNAWDQVNADHNKYAFKLTGKHVDVACEKCHVNGIYIGTPMNCAACHQKDDKHNGQFTQDCGTCHQSTSWTDVKINHDTFAFKLTGAHITVDCAKCHANGVYKSTPQNCGACHSQDDAHGGQFGTNCAQCHSTSAWKPSTFDHNNAAFKLTGAHVSVACSSCHVNGVFKGTPQNCGTCHAKNDPHGGQFGTNCAQCHTTNAWKPSTFNHNNAAFKLTGAHVSVACVSCHINGVFKGTPQTCGACHSKNDPHGGQFGTNCAQCHTTNAWKPSTFDHNNAAFKLTGAHVSVACASCHINSVFKGTPTTCGTCHAKDDNHAGKFGTNCGSCHSTSAWKPATFDHNLTSFPLNGAHASLACSQCHGSNIGPLPTACSNCHAEPAYHAGMFSGQDCSNCHNTSAWRPAQYNGPHSFPMNHGDANTCSDCHQPNLTTWSCALCHNQAKMDEHHKDVPNYDGNCLKCHPTGRKD